MSSVSVRNLTKKYGQVVVLDAVDLDIKSGEFIVILGSSGCGKSTLLNAIAGLDDFDGGGIFINDRDVSRLPPSERGLAMVFQSYALFPSMTVRGNLSFGMKIARTPKAEAAEKVAWVAKLLQIEKLLDRKPSELSGGQRQRVAIGRALVRSSDICLFDEPLSNLDAKLRAETRVELKQLHSRLNSTIIYVTHDQVEAMTMADRVAVMNKGVVEQFDEPQTIYERPATLFVAGFVGSPSMNMLEGTLADEGATFVSADSALATGDYQFGGADRPRDVILGIRSEDITIVEQSTPNSLPARLAFVELLGADALAWFDCRGKRIGVRVSIEDARKMKESVGLHIEMKRASLFSAATQQRL